MKRLLRDAFTEAAPALGEGQDIVVVARPELRELAEREGLSGVQRALGELLDRAGLRVTEREGAQGRLSDKAAIVVPGPPLEGQHE